MAIAIRMAQTTWEGPLASGTGTVRMGSGVPTIVSSHLDVSARVPGLDKTAFDTVVGEPSDLCPVSRLFAGAKVTVDAPLEPAP